MSVDVIRSAEGWYVQRGGGAFPVKAETLSTAEIVTAGTDAVRAVASATKGGVPVGELSLLSPVTHRGRSLQRSEASCPGSSGVLLSREERNPAYLKAGDVITASITTEDGAIDLGMQRTVVQNGQER